MLCWCLQVIGVRKLIHQGFNTDLERTKQTDEAYGCNPQKLDQKRSHIEESFLGIFTCIVGIAKWFYFGNTHQSQAKFSIKTKNSTYNDEITIDKIAEPRATRNTTRRDSFRHVLGYVSNEHMSSACDAVGVFFQVCRRWGDRKTR